MKTLIDTFVIVDITKSHHNSFFYDAISFDKTELDLKCDELNKERNIVIKKRIGNLKNENTIIFYVVKTLNDAISDFHDNVSDYYTPQTEDY